MRQKEDITLKTLSESEEVQVGYSDNDIVVVDSIQRFTEVREAHVMMNAIVICTSGKVQAQMNGHQIVLQKNQVAIIPENIKVADVMVTPDFDMKGMFLTNRILQSFLQEKMYIWNDMMYVHRLHIHTMEDKDLSFYTHFYEMLSLSIERGKGKPFHTDVIQSLLRAAILALCGSMKHLLSDVAAADDSHSRNVHFQRFLDLLHNGTIKRGTVEAYADKLCISSKYLSAICKKQSGKTANMWIREQVLEDIRYSLKHSDLSVKQIADRMGFPNPSFFGKYVKEHFGMTPTQFRKA